MARTITLTAIVLSLILSVGAQAQEKTNLLPDGNLETPSAATKLPVDWAIVGGEAAGNTLESDDTVAYSGKRSVHIRLNGDKDPKASTDALVYTQTALKVEPGKRCTYSAWVKTKGLKGKAYIHIFQYPDPAAPGASAASEGISGTQDWTRLAVVFTVRPDITNFQVRFGLGGQCGDAWFDDLAVEEGGTLPPPEPAAPAAAAPARMSTPTPAPVGEILPNASFEEPNDKYDVAWALPGMPASATVAFDGTAAHSGKRAMHIKYLDPTPPDVGHDILPNVTASAGLEPGKSYIFSAWVKTRGLVGRAYLAIFQYPAPFAPEHQASSNTITGTNDWTLITLPFVARKDLESIQFRCATGSAFGGDAWFDDVTVVARDRLAANDPRFGALADREIQEALDRAKPGDVVVVKPGFYQGGWTMKPGQPGQPITLKSERPGRAFLGSLNIISGLKPLPGARYSQSVTLSYSPEKLRELDTGSDMRWMATSADVEEVVGSFAYDDATGQLVLHPSDSAGAAHHTYASISQTSGITISSHNIVDGFVLCGFGVAAVKADENVTGAVVQNCTLYRNGYGVGFFGEATECVVRNNECWENLPDYSQGGQICFLHATARNVVEDNLVHHGLGETAAINIYSSALTPARGNIFRRNTVWEVTSGYGVTIKPEGEENLSEFNVTTGLLGTNIMRFNTYANIALGQPNPKTDLILREFKEEPKFVDPAWQDFRLQSDSPARGKAEGGRDLGAKPYAGDVLFVKPDGNDKAEGTSIASAWKTLARAAQALKAGQTLYIFPGQYAEPLRLTGKVALAGQKTLVRVHGRGKAQVAAVEVDGCDSLELSGLRVARAAGDGIRVIQSKNVMLLQCAAWQSKGAGIAVQDCRGISIRRCAAWQNGAEGVRATRCKEIEVVSSILGANAAAQISTADAVEDYYGEFNAFLGATTGRSARGEAGDLAAWRAMTLSEGRSFLLSEAPAAAASGDFGCNPSLPTASAGLHHQAPGPDGIAPPQRIARQRFEQVEVISVTRTTANLLWHTPGHMCGTALKWGETEQYGKEYDRASNGSYCEYELIHTVSLVNLEPGTTYHFRPGLGDYWTDGEKMLTVWDGKDYTFTTATEDPAPRQLFVSTEGDDARDGLKRTTAWKSLHKAAREARAGDTVTILPGRYVELLRPLQTGAGPDRPITFRAEKPLSVFLDGGMIRFKRPGRPHAVQIHGKAYTIIENLTGERCSENVDYGGYRGGCGQNGIFRISGGAMNELRGCVADGRYRWMSGIVPIDAGLMPGLEKPDCALRMSDCAVLVCWRGTFGFARAPVYLDHCVFFVNLTGILHTVGGPSKWYSRNCIYQDLIGPNKRSGAIPVFMTPGQHDSDYCAYAWMPESAKLIGILNGQNINGLPAWQKATGMDMHSLEHTPTYPLTGLEKDFKLDLQRSLEVEDFILPKDSPLRGRGENGSDIGVRWEKCR